MVLNEQAEMAKGESARMSSFIGAIAIADLVKSTLGPKGMDKILQSMGGGGGRQEGAIQITNDGATILRSVHVDNAAAKVSRSRRFGVRSAGRVLRAVGRRPAPPGSADGGRRARDHRARDHRASQDDLAAP